MIFDKGIGYSNSGRMAEEYDRSGGFPFVATNVVSNYKHYFFQLW